MQFNKVLIIISPTKIATLCCPVSFPESGHSKLYWAVRRWHIISKRELSKASSSILNSVLLLIAVHYFNMNRKETKLKGLSESRFGSMIFLLRMAGIPLKMKNISIIYAVYMITVIICGFSTFMGRSSMCTYTGTIWDAPWRQCVCWFRSRMLFGYISTAGK